MRRGIAAVGVFWTLVGTVRAVPGARFVTAHGYAGCVALTNADCRVILEPNFGGRVLSLQWRDREALYIDPEQDGWVQRPGRRGPEPCGGRCDIGPEKVQPRRDALWRGRWRAALTGPRAARLVSPVDPNLHVRVVRDVVLDEQGGHVTLTQTVTYLGPGRGRFCHWGRTFAQGDGICLVPLNPHSRYPRGFLIYGPGEVLDYGPAEEANVCCRAGILEILGPPSRPKFAVDAAEGWIAYVTRNNLLFLKTFAVYPDRVYGEMAGNSVSIWYDGTRRTEIEPIGPLEVLRQGESFRFSEHWWLRDFPYPADRRVDLDAIRRIVETTR